MVLGRSVGIKLKQPIIPILHLEGRSRVVAEASITDASSSADYIGEASVVAEVVQESNMSQVLSSESKNNVAEAILVTAPWTNIKHSESHVIAEAFYTDRSIGGYGIQVFDEGVLVKDRATFINIIGQDTDAAAANGGADIVHQPGGIDIYDEGVLIKQRAKHIDIKGAEAEVREDGDGVMIYHPPPTYASHYNTSDGVNDATVPSVSTVQRTISVPTVEGTPFFTGGYAGGTFASTRTNPLVWTTNDVCSFFNSTTTFQVEVRDGDSPQTTIYDFTTAPITGNGIYAAGANCSVTISDWDIDSVDKFKANVSVSVNIDGILPNSGYFDIVITHHDADDGTFTKVQ